MKIALPLILALAVSVLINLSLLRREPASTTVVVTKLVSEAQEFPSVPCDSDSELPRLREESRILKTAGKPSLTSLDNDELFPRSDAREFDLLWDRLDSFIVVQEAEGEAEDGRQIKFRKKVLTQHDRRQALLVLADFLRLDSEPRASFLRLGETAVHFYHRLLEDDFHDYADTWRICERLKLEGKFEEVQTRSRHLSERVQGRHALWLDTDLQPLRSFLEGMEGPRAALLNRSLSDLLSRLGSPDEQ